MSLDNLGNKQTIILHNCEINNEKYDLKITPHTVNRIHKNKTTNNHKKIFHQYLQTLNLLVYNDD